MNATRLSVPLITAVLLVAVPLTQPASAAAARFRVYQMNMCLTGSPHYLKNNAKNGRTGAATCYPNRYVTKDKKGRLHYKHGFAKRERTIARQKRQAVVNHIKRFAPDAVTLNEVCRGDLAAIVRKLRASGRTYTYKAQGVGRGRKCSAKRGAAVDAIIAHRFAPGSKRGGYFEKKGYRAWLCARAGARRVRVCTAHLSLATSTWGGRHHRRIECAKLRRILGASNRATVFGGDVNMKRAKQNCAPARYWGLQDVDTRPAARTPRSGLQHIYYSPGFTRGRSCGSVHYVPHTDHKGFLLDLTSTAKRKRGKACAWRDVKK